MFSHSPQYICARNGGQICCREGISLAVLFIYLGTAGKECDENLALLGLKADDGSQVLLPGGRGKVLLALVAWGGEDMWLFQSRSWLTEGGD
jgi:hypothetical protein